jgi:ABC-type nickel/cobalt efflux system permease component RcnA
MPSLMGGNKLHAFWQNSGLVVLLRRSVAHLRIEASFVTVGLVTSLPMRRYLCHFPSKSCWLQTYDVTVLVQFCLTLCFHTLTHSHTHTLTHSHTHTLTHTHKHTRSQNLAHLHTVLKKRLREKKCYQSYDLLD